MNDMSGTIIAKSDQINAADIIGNPITMTVREVQIKAAGSDDQPVSIYFEGERKAFRPCKGVRRLLVHAWGADANNYIGRSLTLFCDPSVTWAGKEEGGLRVSHMSNIEGEFVFSMRTSRASTKPYKILPLANAPKANARQTAEQWAADHINGLGEITAIQALETYIADNAKIVAKLQREKPEVHVRVETAYAARRAELEQEGPDQSQSGEAFNDDGGFAGD